MKITKKNVDDATIQMRQVFGATPLQKNRHLSELYNSSIWLKREDLSPVRSYKIRGAFNAIRKRIDQEHFVCASAGNHAQGVSFVTNFFSKKATIFMPVTTPQQKINKTKIFGRDNIEIILIGDFFDDCLHEAQKFAKKNNAYFLSPFDDLDVIEGQASVASEIDEQMKKTPDLIIMPVGGGGLSAGIISYFGKNCDYVFVEPTGAASLEAAMTNNKPIRLEKIDNFTDGASVAQIGKRNFQILAKYHNSLRLNIPENRICTTMLEMLDIEGIVLEPAGALAIDSLKDLRDIIFKKNVVCITTGGNFDFERLPEVKERARRFSGLKKYIILQLPQRPGSLKDFLNMLGPDEDITQFEYLKKSARNFGSVLLGIESSSPKKFQILFNRLNEANLTFKDITDDEILSQFLI